jgi:uncharacterized membrane protein
MPDNKKKPEPGAQGNHIPKQAMTEPPTITHEESPRTIGQEKPRVIIKQTPVPEVRIYGQTPHKKYTLGQKAADKITKWAGSWHFIGSFFVLLFIWMAINLYAIITVWDPYPFILLNLVLSCLAAIQAPIILMSQNRSADRDRAKAERDYAINRKSEREVELIKKDLDYIKKKLAEIGTRLK